jgi:hypothetical protein
VSISASLSDVSRKVASVLIDFRCRVAMLDTHVHPRPRPVRRKNPVMIFQIFSPKNLAKILAFLKQNKASFCKNCDHNIGF